MSPDLAMRDRSRLQDANQKRTRDAQKLGRLFRSQLRGFWIENKRLLAGHERKDLGQQPQGGWWDLNTGEVAPIGLLFDQRNPANPRAIQRLAHQAARLREQRYVVVTQFNAVWGDHGSILPLQYMQ